MNRDIPLEIQDVIKIFQNSDKECLKASCIFIETTHHKRGLLWLVRQI